MGVSLPSFFRRTKNKSEKGPYNLAVFQVVPVVRCGEHLRMSGSRAPKPQSALQGNPFRHKSPKSGNTFPLDSELLSSAT